MTALRAAFEARKQQTAIGRSRGISDGGLLCMAYLVVYGLRAATTADAIADAKRPRPTTVIDLTQVRSAIVLQSLARHPLECGHVHDR